jgi:hypothetical protein
MHKKVRRREKDLEHPPQIDDPKISNCLCILNAAATLAAGTINAFQ